eukprot:364302-Chlamydomonas_euryale.AAC.1
MTTEILRCGRRAGCGVLGAWVQARVWGLWRAAGREGLVGRHGLRPLEEGSVPWFRRRARCGGSGGRQGVGAWQRGRFGVPKGGQGGEGGGSGAGQG